jgi:hypothetical protein
VYEKVEGDIGTGDIKKLKTNNKQYSQVPTFLKVRITVLV